MLGFVCFFTFVQLLAIRVRLGVVAYALSSHKLLRSAQKSVPSCAVRRIPASIGPGTVVLDAIEQFF